MNAFSVNLGARRLEMGLTLQQVADRSSLSLPYVSNLEHGRGNPTLAALESLAFALETTASELLAPSDTPGGES